MSGAWPWGRDFPAYQKRVADSALLQTDRFVLAGEGGNSTNTFFEAVCRLETKTPPAEGRERYLSPPCRIIAAVFKE